MKSKFIVCLILFCFNVAAASPQKESSSSIILNADQVAYNKLTNVVTAIGEVELLCFSAKHKAPVILRAREVQYDLLNKQVIASGDVVIKEPNGNYIFADSITLSGDLRDGFVQHAKMLLTDESRLASDHAIKAGDQNVLTHAVYSPCHLCQVDGQKKPPLWQLKASEIIHDEKEKIIIYKHARLEIAGVPIFYLPYFRHPDPSVKRQSGMLMPIYSMSNDLGQVFVAPVYYVIDQSRDLVIMPAITSKQGPVLAAEYRQRFTNGSFALQSSYTRTRDLKKVKSNQVVTPDQDVSNLPAPIKTPTGDRWHVFTKGQLDFTEHNQFSFNINRASDTTYLRRYRFLTQATRTFKSAAHDKNLTSSTHFYHYRPNHFAELSAYAFQTDTPRYTPSLFPLARYLWQSDTGRCQETYNYEFQSVGLARDEPLVDHFSKSYQRISQVLGFQKPISFEKGDRIDLDLSVKADAFMVHQYQTTQMSKQASFDKGRVQPKMAATWSYPFVRQGDGHHWVLSPLVQVVASPHTQNRVPYPQEESSLSQLDHVSLFLPNRMKGYSDLDDGSRLVYGMNNDFYFPKSRSLKWFLGHTRRLDRKREKDNYFGEDQKGSDIINFLKIKPSSYFTLSNRLNISRLKGKPKISETILTCGQKILSLQLSHVFLNKDVTVSKKAVSQLGVGLKSQFNDNWAVGYSQNTNLLKKTGGNLANQFQVFYENECISTQVSFYRSSYRDRDLKPDSGVIVQINFKNLGGISSQGTQFN